MTRFSHDRALTRIAALVATATVAAACSAGSGTDSSSSDRTVEIIVSNFPQLIAGVERTLDSNFERETGIDVEIVNVGGDTTYTGVNQRIQNDLIAGKTPDLAITGLNNVRAYADSQSAIALDEVMEADDAFTIDDLAPNLLKLGQIDGTTYGMPYGVSTYTLYYNADVFRKAGLEPDNPPATFSEMRSAAEAIVRNGAARRGVIIRSDHVGGMGFQNFLESAGGSFMNDDGTQVTFNSPAGVSIVEYWRQLHQEGLGEAVPNDQAGDLFTRGDAGMIFQSSSYSASLANQIKFDVRSAAYPLPDGGDRRAVAGGAAIVAFNRDPQKLADEWTVIKTLVGPRGITNLVEETGFSPINTKATRAEYLGDYLASNPLAAPSWDQMEYLVPWYQFPGSKNNEISKAMQNQINAAISGKQTAQAALDAAARATSSLLS